MTRPADDWQERIEAGLPYYPDPFEQMSTPPEAPGAAPGATPQSGPVYGTPGSGPAYPPPPGVGLPGHSRVDVTQQFAAVPGYGYMAADAGAPYGRDPFTGEPLSDKSKVTAGLLQLLLPFAGICGVGRLYAGHTSIGLIQLLGWFVSIFLSFLLIGIPFVIGIWFWSVIEGILMLAGSIRDAQGRKLRS